VSIDNKIVADLVANDVGFVTTVPCKQLAGVIDAIDKSPDILHVPSNKEDEGMGLCAGAFMGGTRPAIIMQNTAIGVTINTLVLNIPTYHFHQEEDASELDAILKHTFMCNKPVAILTDATFWKGY